MKANSRTGTGLRSRIVAGVVALAAAFSFSAPSSRALADETITVYIDFEGYNLGQGFYIEPTAITLPAGSKISDATAALFELPENAGYETRGLPSYLVGVKGFDKGTIDIPSYITDNGIEGYPGNDDHDGNSNDWLEAVDYSGMSGWMFTANNTMGQEGASAITVHDGDVIRWQFTVWGYGCDLGVVDGCWREPGESAPPYFTMADKTELIRALFAPDAAAGAKQGALDVIINPLATPAQVATALTALQGGSVADAPVLTGLSVNSIAVSGFTASTRSYDVTASGDTATVTASFDDSAYTLTYDSNSYASGAPIGITLADGVTKVTLTLSDKADAGNVATYTVNLLRPRTANLGAAAQVKFTPTGGAVLDAPLINGSKELVLFRADSAGVATTTTGYNNNTKYYRSYLLSDVTNVDFATRVAAAGNWVRVLVGGQVVGAPQQGAAPATTLSFPEIALTGTLTKITVEVCTDATYLGNDSNFIAENSIDFYIERLSFTPEEMASARFLTFTADADVTWPNGAYAIDNQTTAYTAEKSGDAITFTGTVGEGVTVYKHASRSNASDVIPETDGSYILTTTGASQVFATEKVVRGYTLRFPFTVTIYKKIAGAPDAVVEYIVWASQYTNSAGYGLSGELIKYDTLKSLGNFGGHVSVYYEEAIKNDPRHPYGVDFMINGNGSNAGMAEPGYVEVSADGFTWYLLAGSAHFEDTTLRDYTVTYQRTAETQNGWAQSTYTDNYGTQIPINLNSFNNGIAYPVPANYPLFDWRPGFDESYTFTGPLLQASGADPYGSTSAQAPEWGYVDSLANATLGNPVSPYTKATGSASGYDLAWAVDGNGTPVVLDEIHYIRVTTASHIYAGAIGEKSTEVQGFRRVPEVADAVGVTAAPTAIKVNGAPVVLEAGVFSYYNVPFGDSAVTVAVEGADGASVYINSVRGATRSYAAAPLSGVIRVVVQEGEKEPLVYYLNSGDEPQPEPRYNVTVMVGPNTADLSFYETAGFDAAGLDQLGAPIGAGAPGADGSYRTYTLSLPAGTYSVRGTAPLYAAGESELTPLSIGGTYFTVPSAAADTDAFTDTITLRAVNVYTSTKANGSPLTSADYSISLLDADGKQVAIGAFNNYNKSVNNPAYAALMRAGESYNLTLTPVGGLGLAPRAVNLRVNAGTTITNSSQPLNRLYDLIVPSEASVKVFRQASNYDMVLQTPHAVLPGGDGTTIYQVVPTSSDGSFSYRVSLPGHITKAGYIGGESSTVVTFGDDENPADTTNTATPNFNEASTFVNVPNSDNHLRLEVGDNFRLRGFRAAWQIVNNETANKMIEPDFHFTVLEGADVVSVAPHSVIPNWADLTALKPGTAIIEVSYDAIDVATANAGSFGGRYGATDPQRTAIVVVTVGGDGAAAPVILVPKPYTDAIWDSEFDTWYLLGDSTDVSVTVGDDTANVTYWNPMFGDDWIAAEATDEGHTTTLRPGNNVVRAEAAGAVSYKIIRAAVVTPVVTNLTRPGETPAAGDQVKVHLSGLFIPVPKMSGIYNPGFGGTGKIHYVTSDAVEVTLARGTQYDFITTNNVVVTLPDDVSMGYWLEDGYIMMGHMGSTLGTHRFITDSGVGANMNAPALNGVYSVLPAVVLVEPPVTPPVLPDAAQVKAAYDAAAVYQSAAYELDDLGYGAEWVLLGLARGGALSAEQREAYLDALAESVSDAAGVLSSNRYTEYSRVVLALTALGVDATQFDGYDLTAPLADRAKVERQGLNGPIFALLALNSGGYGSAADREYYRDYIVNHQVAGGGWSLSGAAPADPDVTAMALQALAPHYQGVLPPAGVSAAVAAGLTALSDMQLGDAGFVTWGTANSESAAQVITALAALGIGLDDARFTKVVRPDAFSVGETRSVWDAFSAYQLDSGAFAHTSTGGANGMATEQGVYALDALYRVLTGATSLYDMTDVTLRPWSADGVVTPGVSITVSAAGVVVTEVVAGSTITFTGTGFVPGESVRAVVHSEPVDLGSQDADAVGVVSWTWLVPADFEPGEHTVTVTSDSAVAVASFVVLPVGEPSVPTGGELAANSTGLLPFVVLMLLAGVGVLRNTSPRRRGVAKGV
ncbi:MAG: DUF4430 domain-containing protein [Propionibacteriaceae bacterium]|jgi:hypothetical protein|nr:DUF4430 domain-containing protein [Propionibacteriaceae bacterium]